MRDMSLDVAIKRRQAGYADSVSIPGEQPELVPVAQHTNNRFNSNICQAPYLAAREVHGDMSGVIVVRFSETAMEMSE